MTQLSTEEALNHPDAQPLLASAHLLRLGYDGLDGTPRVIPIGFFWNGPASGHLHGHDIREGAEPSQSGPPWRCRSIRARHPSTPRRC